MNGNFIQRYLTRMYDHSAFFLSLTIIIGFLEGVGLIETENSIRIHTAFAELLIAAVVIFREFNQENRNLPTVFLAGSVFFGLFLNPLLSNPNVRDLALINIYAEIVVALYVAFTGSIKFSQDVSTKS